MTNPDIEAAVVQLRGLPAWDEFLTAIEEYKEATLDETENFLNLGNHAVLAGLSQKVELCRFILRIGHIDNK